MKTLKANLTFIVLLAIGLGSVSAQEYDDMYFSSKDRKQVKYVSDNKSVTQNLNEVQDITQDPSQNYSARTVNPEYIAKYQASSQEGASAEFADDEYFVEDYNTGTENLNNVSSSFQNTSGVAVRDRYGNVSYFRDYSDVYWSDPFLYQGTIFDPAYRSYGYGYGYRPYRPYRSGWSVSFGYSSGWLSGYSWSTPYSSWRYGFGYGYGYDPFYCPPYYNSYYGYGYPYRNTVVINNYENRNDRSYRRGPGPSRSGINSNNDGRRRSIVSNNNSNDGRVSTNGRTDASSRSRSIDSRNYDNAQSRYYRRSRTAISSDDSNSGRTYGATSRSSSNDSRSYTNRSNSNSRSSYDSRSSNNRRSSGYTSPSNSRSSGYSPNRSSRSRSSVGSSNSSRSRSSSISSGSSRSSSSRSSGSSRSSSSSKSRRGNN